jgi:LysM repeat protein
MRRLKHTTSAIALAVVLAIVGLLFSPVAPVAAQEPCDDTVTVQPGDTLSAIARLCETTVSALVAANPVITNPNLIFPGQVLQLPDAETPTLPTEGFVYTVQPGDWLADIARRHGVSVDTLLAVNPQVEAPDELEPGDQLVIPATEVLPELGPAPIEAVEGFIYTVQPGDWLADIARRHGVSVDTLLAVNPQVETPDELEPGDQLVIPITEVLPELGPPAPPEEVDGFFYTVQSGDWLSAIARRHGVSLTTLLAANPQIENPNLIFPGQQIVIPQ